MGKIKELINETNKISEQLDDKNHEIFYNIALYMRGSLLSEEETEETIQDILDMFLRAQHNNEPIENIIGNNPKEFCDEIINSYNKFSFKRLLNNLKLVLNCFCILLGIDFINDILFILKFKPSFDYNITLSFLINSICITCSSFFIINYIGKTTINNKSNDKKTSLLLICFWAFIFAFSMLTHKTLGKFVLIKAKIYYIILIILALYFIVYILNKKIAKS